MGNGLSNIIAATIIALAVVYTGGFGDRGGAGDAEQYDAWLSRAVGDIRNDIVVNCGCCGDEGPGGAASGSF
ncbi:MAG: hypothetical protein GXP04_10715 [Alphaproteobacteria bacterium]|nr:hypothetical protein [Marinicaulis sp.]NOX95533.1 hypothetical protein [Alphaproteobacteria bacterium]